jgi:hypothetical protein
MRLALLLTALLLLSLPVPAAPRYIIVMIGYLSERTPLEKELKERLKELLIEIKAPRGTQFSYHFDAKDKSGAYAERKFCETKLKVTEKDLVFLGVARVDASGRPEALVFSFPRADFNLEQAAQDTVYQWRLKSGLVSYSSSTGICRLDTSLPMRIAR